MKKTRVFRNSESSDKAQSVVTTHPAAQSNQSGPLFAKDGETSGGLRQKRHRPVMIATAASLLWLAVAAYLGYRYALAPDAMRVTLETAALLLAGAVCPIIMIWLIALVVLQTRPPQDQTAALTGRLDDLLQPVHIAERRIDALAALLRQKIDDVATAEDVAGQRLKSLENHFGEQIREIHDVTIMAESRTANIQETLAAERQGLQALVTEMEHRTTELRMMAENLTETLRNAASDARAEARAASDTMTEHAALLATSSRQTLKNLEEIGVNLSDYTTKLHETSLVAEQAVVRVGGSMVEQQASLTGTLDVITAKTENLRSEMRETLTELTGQSHLLEKTTHETASSMAASITQLTEQTEKLSTSAHAVNDKLDETSAKMETRDAAMRQFLERLETELGAAEKAAGMRTDHLNEISHDINNRLEDIVLRMKAQSSELGETAKSAVGELEDFSLSLETRMNDLRQASTAATDEILKAANTLKLDLAVTLSETGDAASRLHETGSQVNADQTELMTRYDAAFEKIQALGASLDQHMAGVTEAAANAGVLTERIGATLTASARDIDNASTVAHTAADVANRALAAQTEELMKAASEIGKSSDELMAHAARLETKTSTRDQNIFARTSSFVIEALSSQAIDIHRVLETDIPDEVWQKYLKGDRSIFARRTVRLGTRQTRDLIARKFREDGEFREHVLRYIKEFEKLMAHALTADPQGPLSVTLVSSEMGKLYVLLAQSLNRLS